MAGLQHRNGSYRILFRYNGKQHAFTLGEVSEQEAEAKASQCDYLLLRIKQRLAVLPQGMDIIEYLQTDGKPRPPSETGIARTTLDQLQTRYLAAHERSLEASTIEGIKIHFDHLIGFFGKDLCISDLTLAELQRYVNKRSQDDGIKGRKLAAATILKEIVTLRTAFNFAVAMKYVAGPFPNKGLRYPKSTEKPPFLTRDEIEARIKDCCLTPAEINDLYESMYLTIDELAELLTEVKAKPHQPFVYPMISMAAYTGARRSELLRTKIADVDFKAMVVTIHERKRVRGKCTTRRVPISPFLCQVLKDWLAVHPGGPLLFVQQAIVERSKKRSATTGHLCQRRRPKTTAARNSKITGRLVAPPQPVTVSEAHDHLKRAVSESKWKELRGWHVFRHSFVSALASRGTDQRLVETWAGHMSKDMSRRYAHLYPSTQQQAMAAVFG